MKTSRFNLKTGKIGSWTGSWPVGGFLFFFTSQVIILRRFGPFVLKWKSNPKPKLKSLSPHLQASSSDENLTHAACLKLASASVKLAARLSQACLKLAARCSLLASVKLASSSLLAACLSQALSLHSGALCTAAATLSAQRLAAALPALLRFACSALCTAAQVMFYF